MASTQHHHSDGWFDWAYKGVDHSLPGNGGVECRNFLSFNQRCWESLGASIVALLALALAYPRLRLPRPTSCTNRCRPEPMGKRLLLLLMCLTFGIEIGFKLATRQMIWIGNPCHLATMLQIFILAAPPSRIVTAAFRLHMHMLTGAPIAILFPVVNTRLLPFETSIYFLQHILMLVIPFCLMNIGDPYIPEKLGDFSWAMVSFGILFLYHFLPLQMLAYVSQVNLNNMLCPAVSDPFHGKFYRLFAMAHQLILIPTMGKLLVILARALGMVPSNNPSDECHFAYTWHCESMRCPSNTTTTTAEQSCEEVGDSSEVDSGITAKSSGYCTCQLGCTCYHHTLSSMKAYQACCDHAASYQYNYSCSNSQGSKQVGSIMHIVNGKIIGDPYNEQSLRQRDITDQDKGQHNSDGNQKHQGPDESNRTASGDINKCLRDSALNDCSNGHTKSL